MNDQITALKAELAVLKAENEQLQLDSWLFRTFLEVMPDHVYFKDTESRFLRINTAKAKIHGFQSWQELVGLSDADIYSAEAAQHMRADEQAIMDTAQIVDQEEYTIINDQAAWLHTLKLPLYRDGKIAGTFGISTNITERKNAEDALKQLNTELEVRVQERTQALEKEIEERQYAEEERARLQQKIIETQQRTLLDLATPIIPIMEGIIIMPLIGNIDSTRAQDIMRSLLSAVTDYRAEIVLLDITGVSLIDTGIAGYLNKTIQATRLKGAQIILTGISDAVAETIVDLGIEWDHVVTLNSLQNGLRHALHYKNLRIVEQ